MSAPRVRDATVVAAIVRRVGASDPVALTNAAWFAARRGQLGAARECIERALACADAPRTAQHSAAMLREHHPEQLLLALPSSSDARKPPAPPDDANVGAAMLAEGRGLLAAGRLSESLTLFDGVLRLRPSDPVALFHRGVALAKLRRYGDALHVWHAVERSDPAGALGTMSRRHADSARRLAELFTG